VGAVDDLRLTDEQSRLVEENYPMVVFMSNKYPPPHGMDLDDWRSELCIVLAKAVVWHRPEKGKLSTLFDALARSRRVNIIQLWKAMRRNGGIIPRSLDAEHGGIEGNTLEKSLGREDDGFEQVDRRDLIDLVMDHGSSTGRKIMSLLMQNMSLPDIGKKMGGYSRQYACQALAVDRARLCNLFPDEVRGSGRQCAECPRPVVVPSHMSKTTFLCPSCAVRRLQKKKRDGMKRFHGERRVPNA
jgi:DNA-directed RNA polymerase subunit RPC12/RpoP